jgi:hypothetical protein
MERLTIIPIDGAVYLTDVNYLGLDLSFVPEEVHALQWRIDSGWIEHKDHTQETISELPAWALQAVELATTPPIIPEKTLEEILREFNFAIQGHIDSIARSRQYESSLHCASYANSTVESWAAESQAFIAWRDSVWSYSYTELAKFENGERQAVTVDEFLTELPAIVWPNQGDL